MKSASALVLAAALVSFAAAGCAGAAPQAVVRAHAAGDLACPGGRLDVQGIGGASFAASGCGQSAVYSCNGGGEGDPFGASCARVGGVTELQAP
ncbi:MAG TPA: hypothetical protein VMI75_05650 [Polyangiaceae bacterium]|nr:hypothetical protein [Polyangiaceae bacterium]